MWRGPAGVLWKDGKNVIVKHGSMLRDVARLHVTRIKGKKKGKES